jgi:hypothetical protein
VRPNAVTIVAAVVAADVAAADAAAAAALATVNADPAAATGQLSHMRLLFSGPIYFLSTNNNQVKIVNNPALNFPYKLNIIGIAYKRKHWTEYSKEDDAYLTTNANKDTLFVYNENYTHYNTMHIEPGGGNGVFRKYRVDDKTINKTRTLESLKVYALGIPTMEWNVSEEKKGEMETIIISAVDTAINSIINFVLNNNIKNIVFIVDRNKITNGTITLVLNIGKDSNAFSPLSIIDTITTLIEQKLFSSTLFKINKFSYNCRGKDIEELNDNELATIILKAGSILP